MLTAITDAATTITASTELLHQMRDTWSPPVQVRIHLGPMGWEMTLRTHDCSRTYAALGHEITVSPENAQAAIARALAHVRPPGNPANDPATPAYTGPYTACPTCTREDTTDAR